MTKAERQQRASYAGWRRGCAVRDRSWKRDRWIFDQHAAGRSVEDLVAEMQEQYEAGPGVWPWGAQVQPVRRAQSFAIIRRIREAREEKAALPKAERRDRRCSRGAWLRTERIHHARLRRRLEFGVPYEAPAFPASFRRQYPERLAAKYRESSQPFRGKTPARESRAEAPIAWQEEAVERPAARPDPFEEWIGEGGRAPPTSWRSIGC